MDVLREGLLQIWYYGHTRIARLRLDTSQVLSCDVSLCCNPRMVYWFTALTGTPHDRCMPEDLYFSYILSRGSQ